MYADGRGVAKDESKAVSWWTAAAEQGVARAQFALGSTALDRDSLRIVHAS
jgi:TPR repeat protein